MNETPLGFFVHQQTERCVLYSECCKKLFQNWFLICRWRKTLCGRWVKLNFMPPGEGGFSSIVKAESCSENVAGTFFFFFGPLTHTYIIHIYTCTEKPTCVLT